MSAGEGVEVWAKEYICLPAQISNHNPNPIKMILCASFLTLNIGTRSGQMYEEKCPGECLYQISSPTLLSMR